MYAISPRKHGTVHARVCILLAYRRRHRGASFILGFPCICMSIDMAGVGDVVTPMSRLSQHGSRRRALAVKTLESSSPSATGKKKNPKRKTLTSRYTAVIPSKRRKLELNRINEHENHTPEEYIQAPEDCDASVSPKTCNGSDVFTKERDVKIPGRRGRPPKSKNKAKGRPRNDAIIKSNRGNSIEVCSERKGVVLKGNSNDEVLPSSIIDPTVDSICLHSTIETGVLPDSLLKHALNSSLAKTVNLHTPSQCVETDEAVSLPSSRKSDADSVYSEPQQNAERNMQGGQRARGRKKGKGCSNIQTPCSELKNLRENELYQLKDKIDPPGHQTQDSIDQGEVESRPHLNQDPSLLAGRFLRPSRKAKKKAKLEENRLPPWDYVGKRVVVYWPHAKAWYAGKVIMYDDTNKKHKIKYDDSDEECISFRRHKVILEKSFSSQMVNSMPRKAKPPGRAQLLAEEPTDGKPHEGDCDDDQSIEDNLLLSALAPKPRSKGNCMGSIGNGPLTCMGAVKGVDTTLPNNTVANKSSRRFTPSPIDDMGRPSIATKGVVSEKEAFVYVRRTKGRRKDDVSHKEMTLDQGLSEANSSLATEQQGSSRKRKIIHSFPQQGDETQVGESRLRRVKLDLSDTLDCFGMTKSNGNALERASRKRNRRSLKTLVDQASALTAMHTSQAGRSLQNSVNNGGARKAKGKLSRKQKLKNALSNARNRRLSLKRVLCLENSADELAVEGTSSVFCQGVSKHDSMKNSPNVIALNEAESYFHRNVHLLSPVSTPGLFTWQLFSIMKHTHFCDGGSFNDRVSIVGSMSDWIGIFRILHRIVKTIPFDVYMSGRKWQSMILHDLWNSMPRWGEASADAFRFLPNEIEAHLFELFYGASVSCKMTSREIFNLFVFYFLKPYIISTICEKDMQMKIAVQHFSLLVKSERECTTCLQESIKWFPSFTSSGSADEAYLSYLMHFPWPDGWCTADGFFTGQMEAWVSMTDCTGSAEGWIPIPAVKRIDNLVWQLKCARLVVRGNVAGGLKKSKFTLKGAHIVFLNKFHTNCLRHVEERNRHPKEKNGRLSGPCDGYCLLSSLLLTASLWKRLNRKLEKVRVSSRPFSLASRIQAHPNKESETPQQTLTVDKLHVIGTSGSVAEDVTESKVFTSHLESENNRVCSPYSHLYKSPSKDVNAIKRIKIEPDSNFCLQRLEKFVSQKSIGNSILESDLVADKNQSRMNDQYFPVQNDQEYYDNKLLKGGKMSKKMQPRYRNERQKLHSKERPAYLCTADLVVTGNESVERELDVKVQLRPDVDGSFVVTASAPGKSVEKKVGGGSMLLRNPPEFSWKSGSGWMLEFSNKEQWEVFRCSYNELCLQATRATCVREIPIPDVKQMMEKYGGYTQPKAFLRPFFAIKSPMDEIEAAFATGRILYDLDSEDEFWMVETNSTNKDSGSELISDDMLERVIDKLEKEAFRRGETTIAVHDAIEFCKGLTVADTVRAVHGYWSKKRQVKGKPLLRHFQPPLWEQYQEELRAWEMKMQQYSPDTQTNLQIQYPRPVMSAFCLQSRSLDPLDTGKRMLRQRSQRKIRPTSRSSSEDLHRPTAAGRHPLQQSGRATTKITVPRLHWSGYVFNDVLSDSAKVARSKAMETRRLAEIRALKSQNRFLEFDLILQKAWAFLIEYAVAGSDISAQNEGYFEESFTHLFSRCSSLLNTDEVSSEDDLLYHPEQVSRDVDDEFLEAFTSKCSLNGKVFSCHGEDKTLDEDTEEASPLLPVSVKGSSYVWNGSSLL
ncbi:hypothetical protein KP509_33G056900 [Ceratopteris richardii]|uniref:Enhancer of polycomb-like protein n=1 Tax=Ceratopteris richardii TaxID=49495 RepID=A0A8T2QR41_CERRI|nr:hypothetical protein KP509_33G056900 [Ceratopteris richardii]KAH7286060.1 hypothetical protein KP509_33G056900 [Ceratopteris richardii]